MYEELLEIGKKYFGVMAPKFIDAVLKEANIDKDSISSKDLDAIISVVIAKISDYGLSREAYEKPIIRDIKALNR